MKALVWHGDQRLVLEDVPEPVPGPDEVLFRVRLAGICGSDLHPYRGKPGPRRAPLVLGHEAVGEVDGLDGLFALFPLVSCGRCEACRRGEENLCDRRGLVGLDRQGVFAESVCVASDALVRWPDGLDERLGSLAEPLATSVAVARTEAIGPAMTVAVIGLGPLGLLTVYHCVRLGARVVAADPLERRRRVAERLGACATFADAAEIEAASVDVAIDAVAVEASWRGAIAASRRGGSVVIIGLGQEEGAVPIADVVRRGVSVRGHYAYTRQDFADAVTALTVDPPPLDWVSVLPLDAGASGFRRLVEEPEDVVKVVLSIASNAY